MSPITLRDGLGATFTVAAESNGGVATPHSVPEVAGAAVSAGNPMPVGGSIIASPATGLLVDRSIVASASVSTQLMAANVARRFFRLQAPQGAAIWFSPVGTTCSPNTTGCFYLPAGGLYESGNFVGTNAVTCWCATANLVVAATEG